MLLLLKLACESNNIAQCSGAMEQATDGHMVGTSLLVFSPLPYAADDDKKGGKSEMEEAQTVNLIHCFKRN